MKSDNYTLDQKNKILAEIAVRCGQGEKIKQILKYLKISGSTYYRWKQNINDENLSVEDRIRKLEKENKSLKKAVADLSLENAILKNLNINK